MESDNVNDGLRKKAEAELRKGNITEFSGDEKKLLEELSIHQIELEMQNQELRESELQLQKEKEKI